MYYDFDASNLLHRWYAFLGMSDVAVKHIMEVLACGHQSKTTQELFLRDFFQIVQVINNCSIAFAERNTRFELELFALLV